MSKEKRFVIQVDPLEMEDDAIFDNKELRLYECQSDMMSDICSLLNKQEKRIAELEDRWQKLKEWVNEFNSDCVAVYPKTLLNKIQELENGEEYE